MMSEMQLDSSIQVRILLSHMKNKIINLSNKKITKENHQHKDICKAFHFAVKSGSCYFDFSRFAAWPEFHSLSSAD